MEPVLMGGYMAGGVLAASGIAGVLMPQRVGRVLHTDLSPARARAEFRIAYACFAAVGFDALVAGAPAVFTAVGALWLAAAGVRLVAIPVDRPRADWTYWTFLALEALLGAAGVLAGR